MMRTTFQTILIVILLTAKTFAQDFSCANLSKEIYSDSEIKKPNTTDNPIMHYGKSNTQLLDVRYTNDFLGGNQCSKTNGCADGSDKLQYQVYYPNITYATPLPAIILFHGGGFSDCTNFTNSDGMVTYCTQFAKRGFVAFNVEYRRGRIEDTAKKYTSASDVLALYRAVQDARGAIRTIVARELSKSTPYRIDVNNLFLSGASSGSVIALDIGFLTPNMVYQIFPDVKSHLGAIDTNNYAGNATTSSYTIRGILNLWGGASVPVNYANNPEDFFLQNPHLPVLIAFQGGSDNVVKITTDNLFYSTAPSTYASESSCVEGGVYTLSDNGAKNADLKTFGSQGLYDILSTTFKIPCELYIDCDMKHGLDEATSDFGLANGDASAVTDKQVQKYIVQRAATFFQYVMNTNFPYTLTHTKFVDCLNTRYGCNSDANTTCTNNAMCSGPLKTSSVSQESIITKKQSGLFTMAQANKTVYINFYKAGNATVILFNLNGTPVRTLQSNNRETTLDCTDLSSGFYLLRVMQDNILQSAKIILP